MSLKMCSGCGHLSDEPIKKPAYACCPDASYHYVPDELESIIIFNRDKNTALQEENAQLKAKPDAVWVDKEAL